MNSGYEPAFDLDFRRGEEAEEWLEKMAFRPGCIEVKRDDMAAETGRVYVEYQCRRSGQYRDSGIATTAADYWAFVIGLGKRVIILSIKELRLLARWHYKNGWVYECTRGSHPTRGVLIPLEALAGGARKIGPKNARGGS